MWIIYLPINDGNDDQKDFLGGQITFFGGNSFFGANFFFGATIFFDTNPLFGANLFFCKSLFGAKPPLHTDQGALTFPNKTSSEVKHCQLLQMELCVNLSSPSALRRAGYTHRAMQTGKHHVNLIVFVFDYCIFICICIWFLYLYLYLYLHKANGTHL